MILDSYTIKLNLLYSFSVFFFSFLFHFHFFDILFSWQTQHWLIEHYNALLKTNSLFLIHVSFALLPCHLLNIYVFLTLICFEFICILYEDYVDSVKSYKFVPSATGKFNHKLEIQYNVIVSIHSIKILMLLVIISNKRNENGEKKFQIIF